MKSNRKLFMVGLMLISLSIPAFAQKANSNKSLAPVFENYFAVKDALVKTDGSSAALNATALLSALESVDASKLSKDEQVAWTKVSKDLLFDAEHISDTKDAGHQRDHFGSLSTNLYQLMKVSKQEESVYYQRCPMANKGKGANWLSKDKNIQNPYYGAKMLTCGKTIETL